MNRKSWLACFMSAGLVVAAAGCYLGPEDEVTQQTYAQMGDDGGVSPVTQDAGADADAQPDCDYYCYAGFRPIQIQGVPNWIQHTYTYCFSGPNKTGTRLVFEDQWAGAGLSGPNEDNATDAFLGCATLAELNWSRDNANDSMWAQCYGRRCVSTSGVVTHQFGQSCPAPAPGGGLDAGVVNEGDDAGADAGAEDPCATCTEFEYPDWPDSYSIAQGCYCYPWQTQFRLYICQW